MRLLLLGAGAVALLSGCAPDHESGNFPWQRSGSGSALATATLGSSLDAVVRGVLLANPPTDPAAGYAVGVVKDGQVVLSAGYGMRDKAHGLPVTPDTRFGIGSNTKSFTVLALAQLKDRGVFSFTQPTVTYLPDFAMIDPLLTLLVTPEDMLSHRTGLPRHDNLWSFTPLTRAEILPRMRYLELDNRPGYGFRQQLNYNNLMYMAAGTIVERLDGRSWEDYLKAEVLGPLGMTSTDFGLAGLSGNRLASVDYADDGTAFPAYADLTNVGPAGSINSTVGDMLKYLGLYLSLGHDPAGNALVSQAELSDIFSPRVATPDRVLMPGTTVSYYGMGWWVNSDGTRWWAFHGGQIAGFYSQMAFEYADQAGVVVLANHLADPNVNRIASAVLGFLDQAPAVPQDFAAGFEPRMDPEDLGGPRPGYALPAAPAAPLAPVLTLANFVHPAYGEVSLVTDGVGLYYQWYGNDWPTWNYSGDVWLYLMGSPSLGIAENVSVYGRDASGQVNRLYPNFEPNATSVFWRVP